MTNPESWTAAAMYQATRIFVSNMNAKMAQRYMLRKLNTAERSVLLYEVIRCNNVGQTGFSRRRVTIIYASFMNIANISLECVENCLETLLEFITTSHPNKPEASSISPHSNVKLHNRKALLP